MQIRNYSAAALLCALAGGVGAQVTDANPGDIIITEIFYATNQGSGSEGASEFVELYNTTGADIDVSGYFLIDADADLPNEQSDPFPAGTVIPAGGALVVAGNLNDGGTDVNDDITVDRFEAAWDAAANGINFIILDDTINLSNSPNLSSPNEVVELRRPDTAGGSDITLDSVNYDDAAPWPSDSPQGVSIVLLPNFLNATDNDNGLAWRRSDSPQVNGSFLANGVFVDEFGVIVPEGTPGALTVFPSDQINLASPGFVDDVPDTTDCNANGIPDPEDIFFGTSEDCNGNGIPDECEADCNGNGIPDDCDIRDGFSQDCNLNGIPDECDIADGTVTDIDGDGVPDICSAGGDVIITEILFDPGSGFENSATEFVEIFNATDGPVDISGYRLGDLDDAAITGQDSPNAFQTTSALPGGTVLAAGEAAILIPDFRPIDDPDSPLFGIDPVSEFRAGWAVPTSVQVFALEFWGARANNASPGDEVLTLLDSSGLVSDIVDYDATNTLINENDIFPAWPDNANGHSFYLRGSALDGESNNDGLNWEPSIPGIAGAYYADGLSPIYNSSRNAGSPGIVDLNDPQPVNGDVVITEILFAPNGAPIDSGFLDDNAEPILVFPPTEFVEILNVSAGTIDLSGWFLQDEDGRTVGMPDGTSIASGEAVVLYQNDVFDSDLNDATGGLFTFASTADAINAFYDAWGCGYQVIPLDGWGFDRDVTPGSQSLRNLSNGPRRRGNEILTLRNASGGLVDLVDFDDEGQIWPLGPSGSADLESFSFYLRPETDDLAGYASVDNNIGLDWFDAFEGEALTRRSGVTDIFNSNLGSDGNPIGGNVASPGAVEFVIEPDLDDCPPMGRLCADVNLDGSVTPTDFGAWLAAFNAGDLLADANQDGSVSPTDFGAWLAAFNLGANGPICNP